MTIASTLLRIIGALGLGLALGGCSAIKLGYSNAPEIAYWRLDSYLSFNDPQVPQVRLALSQLHQWHRTAELPRYADLLKHMETLMAREVTAEQVCTLASEIRQRYVALLDQSGPAAARIAMTLTADQLQHLQRHYDLGDADYSKEWLKASPTERQNRRLKQWVERSEMVYGTLDDAQNELLRQHVMANTMDSAVNFKERQRRQGDLLKTLRTLSTPPLDTAQALARLKAYFERTQVSPDASIQAERERQLKQGCHTLAALHNRTTAAQRDIAVKRLRAYQRDARELAALP